MLTKMVSCRKDSSHRCESDTSVYTLTGSTIPPLIKGLPKNTQSLCPECLAVIPATQYEQDGKVLMTKHCSAHGDFLDIVSSDVRIFLEIEKWHFRDGQCFANPQVLGASKCPTEADGKLYPFFTYNSGIPSEPASRSSMSRTGKNSLCVVVLLTVLWMVCPSHTYASDDSFQVISGDEQQKILEKMKTLQRDIHSLHAHVSQEKQLTILKKKLLVEGTVMIAKPNQLRWDVVKPERSITAIDGETITVYHPDKKEAQVRSLSESLIAGNTMSFFMAAMNGSLQEIDKNFTVQIFRKDGEIIFKLTPLSSMVGKYLSAVTIHYDEASGLPRGFEMLTPKGDKTITRLTNIKTNPGLKPETFKIKLPDDVWITNKFEHPNY